MCMLPNGAYPRRRYLVEESNPFNLLLAYKSAQFNAHVSPPGAVADAFFPPDPCRGGSSRVPFEANF